MPSNHTPFSNGILEEAELRRVSGRGDLTAYVGTSRPALCAYSIPCEDGRESDVVTLGFILEVGIMFISAVLLLERATSNRLE